MCHRPVFTGDVFDKVTVHSLGEIRTRKVMVLQHPCALRTNGVDLQPRLFVAEVRPHPVIPAEGWTGHVAKMPLPELMPTLTSSKRHQAAFFDAPYLVGPDALNLDQRIACLSQAGVNLLLQRWVHHNSRAVIPTTTYQEVSSPAYEEADLIEEWCEERVEAGVDIHVNPIPTSQGRSSCFRRRRSQFRLRFGIHYSPHARPTRTAGTLWVAHH